MLPSTTLYKSVLYGPHHRAATVDVFDIDGNTLALDVPVVDGTVTANLTNRVTRVATFTLSDEWYPRLPTDPLSPYQSVVKIRAGTRYGDGSSETFPIFMGRVYDVTRNENGSVTFRADDLAADVLAYRFEQPQASSSVPFTNVVTEIRKLILEALPQATFGTDDVPLSDVPPLVWDEDRGQALDDLAEAVGGRWYALGDGSFVVRQFTYGTSPAVQEFADGPQGLMLSAITAQTRDGAANSVVVVSERLDGSEPIRVIARDLRTGSPTRFAGTYGKVSQVIKVQTPLSQIEAQTLARTQLTAAVALTEQWNTEVVPDYTLEPGDTVRLRYRGLMADQIIDTIDYPLMTGRPMTLNSRGTVPTDIVGA